MMNPSAPRPKKPAAEVDSAIDDALNRIDQCLPAIHERVERGKRAGDTPSAAFNARQLVQTQRVFQAMAEEPLLTKSGEDILVDLLSDSDVVTPVSASRRPDGAHAP